MVHVYVVTNKETTELDVIFVQVYTDNKNGIDSTKCAILYMRTSQVPLALGLDSPLSDHRRGSSGVARDRRGVAVATSCCSASGGLATGHGIR